MKDIKITDNFKEAVEIGKELFEEKKEIYTEAVTNSIYKTIEFYIPDAAPDYKEDIFYHSIYDYWVYGATTIEELYFEFYKISDKEKRKYITTREKVLYINHLNNKSDAYILDDKYETYKRFKKYYNREMIVLNDEADYEKFVEFTNRHKEFAVKPADLGLGIGVHKATVTDTDDKLEIFRKILNEGKQYTNETHRLNSTAVVIEEIIQQSKGLAPLHSASVNNIRVTTIRVGDKIHIYHPFIRIGTNDSFAVNSWQGAIFADVDEKTGVIDTQAVSEYGFHSEFHPHSGMRIKDFQIPKWNELVTMVKELSSQLPSIRYIGWDFALTDSGWVVIEGNYSGDFLWQFCLKKGMKNEFEDLIGWKLNKKFWWE